MLEEEKEREREREREVIMRCMYMYIYLHFSSQFPVMANVLAAKEACTGGRERERENKREKEILILTNSYIHYQYSWVWPQKLKTKNFTITKYFPRYSSNPPLTSSSLSLTFWINKMEYVSIILYHVHLLHCLYGVH